MGKQFDVTSSISSQLPFFCCTNNFINKENQKDISQYLYCKDFNIPAFKGSYGDQPNRWVLKVGAIKYALAKKEQKIYKQQKAEAESKG